jgi:uncharacterized membrane protein required for colicin V production
MAAVYCATIVSASFYDSLGDSIQGGIDNMQPATADLIAFMTMMTVLVLGFYVVIAQTIRTVEHRRGRFAILDNIGGAALGIIVGVLTVALTISVTVVLLGALNQSAFANGIGNLGFIGRQVDGSALVPLFVKLQPAVVSALRPWFPDGLPAILQPPTGI